MAKQKPKCGFCNSDATHFVMWDCGDQWHDLMENRSYECGNHPRMAVCMWCREGLQRMTNGGFHETRISPPMRHVPMTEETVINAVEEILRDARTYRHE